MKPLVIRRAGEFEKTGFDLAVVVGVYGLFPGSDISLAVSVVFSFATWWFFSLLIIAGVAGRVVTWRTDRDRTIPDIRYECTSEGLVLGVLASTWLIYMFGSIVLLLDGRSSTIPMLFSIATVVACIRRGIQIYRDLRKIKRALSKASPPVPVETLGDPDTEEA